MLRALVVDSGLFRTARENFASGLGRSAFAGVTAALLAPAQPEETDEAHMILIEGVEDEYYVRIDHPMTKSHYISFIAALSQDRLQLVRLYPEGNAEARFKISGVQRLFFCCNRDGLFSVRVHKAIDAKPSSYDQTEERRALEEAAKMIFG